MAPMMFFGFSEMLMLLLVGGGLPLGLPPAEPDPMMAQVAPEKCLFYLSWSAMAKPDPDSENHTERLLSEPEVQRFVLELKERIQDSINRETRNGPPAEQKMAELIPPLVVDVATSHAAIFVESMQQGAAGPAPPIGVVINVGEKAAQIEEALGEIQQALMGQKDEPVDGIHTWPTPPFQPEIKWTIRDGYFVGGFGKGTLERILDRMKKKETPEWLTAGKKRLPVDRVSNMTYVNTKEILAMVMPMVGVASPQAGAIIADLGLNNIQSVFSVTGLDGKGIVARTLVQTDGKPQGLLGLLQAGPISPDDLSHVPGDSMLAFSLKLDPKKVLDGFLAMFERMEPGSSEEFDAELEILAETIGFNITQELLPALGDNWTLYASPASGGPVPMGITGVVSVRDPEELMRISGIIEERVNGMHQELQARVRRAHGVTIKRTAAAGQTIFYFNTIGEEFPFSPAWCIAKDKLVISLYPQYIAEWLTKDEDAPSLATLPHIAAALKDRSPVMLAHFDSEAIFRTAYPFVMMGANVVAGELQQEGIDIDITLMPPGSVIARHMQPTVGTVSVGDDGIEVYAERTLPISVSPAPAAMLPWMFFARSMSVQRIGEVHAHDHDVAVAAPVEVPAARVAPAAIARPMTREQLQSTNNLKQIIVAMHNYHAQHRHLPPAAPKGENGKANLSWRVHLLPLLNSTELYREFHLDEPWDSPHNRKLIPKIPKWLQTPGGKGEPGTTHYVVLRGERTLFPNDGAEIGFQHVRDGASNTIAVVEAAKPVIWTKPDDLEFDSEKAKAGLVGLRRGSFIAAFADGSVISVPETTTSEVIRRLMIRDDGKPVSRRAIQQGRAVAPAVRAVPGTAVKRTRREAATTTRPAPPKP